MQISRDRQNRVGRQPRDEFEPPRAPKRTKRRRTPEEARRSIIRRCNGLLEINRRVRGELVECVLTAHLADGAALAAHHY